AEDILDPERRAGQRPEIAPRLASGVDRVGPAPRPLGVDLQVTAERAVEAPDAVQELLRHLARAERPGPHAVGDGGQAGAARVHLKDLLAAARRPPGPGDDARNLEEARLAARRIR